MNAGFLPSLMVRGFTRHRRFAGFCLIAIASLVAQQCRGQSPAELLEKGIYNEETVGDLEAAIKFYREAVSAAEKTQTLAARAQFRLGQCLMKQQKKEDAIKVFRELTEKFPRQKQWIDKAKQYLPADIELTEATWQDGVRETLVMKLPGGQTVGLIGLSADKENLDDRPVWAFSIRRFVSGGNNQGISRAWVDESSLRPIKTTWRHTVLGNASAEWGADSLKINQEKDGGESETIIPLSDVAYANDQWFYCFRCLPLQIGYKVTLPIRVAFTGGNPIGLEIDVTKKESVTTPLGEFECFRLETNIQQTFWIADRPDRKLVKFVGGGVEAVLTHSGVRDQPQDIENVNLGFEFTVPANWHLMQPIDQADAAAYVIVDQDMASVEVSVKERDKLSEQDRSSVDQWMQSKLDRGKGVFKDFKPRQDSTQSIKIAGHDGKLVLSDFTLEGTPTTSIMALLLTDSKAIALAMNCRTEDVPEHRPEFQRLLESIELN